MGDPPAFMTLAAYARHHGVSKPTVTGWKRRGYVVLTADGKVDVAASDAHLAARPSVHRGGTARVRPGQPIGPGSPPIVPGIEPAAERPAEPRDGHDADSHDGADPARWSRSEALRQREIAQAQLARLEADREAGKLVAIEEVAASVGKRFTVVRTALLALPSKLAIRLAAASSPEACGALLETEIRDVLEALSTP